MLEFFATYWIVFVLIALLLGLRRLLPPTAHGAVQLAREACLGFALYQFYFLVRGTVKDQVGEAFERAHLIIEVEQRLGLFWELALHQAVVNSTVLVTLANWVYVWWHWPVIVGVLVWLFQRHREHYPRFRNAVLLSGALGLLIYGLFPVAPPRFVDSLGMFDTVMSHSGVHQLLLPQSMANQYAAMPSLHAGWNLLMAIAIWRHTTVTALRYVAIVMPVVMFLSIVSTANHYILDGLAGWAVALIGLAGASVAGVTRQRMTLSPT